MTDRHFLPAFETEFSLIDLRVSIFIRWIALSGQLTTVLIVHFALGFLLPLIPLLTIIAIGIILNLWQSWLNKNAVQLSRLSVLFVLIFDVTQLAALLYFAGGLLNPFSILFLAPVAVSAAILDVFSTINVWPVSVERYSKNIAGNILNHMENKHATTSKS